MTDNTLGDRIVTAAIERGVTWLSDEQVQAIEATLPKCPTCGGDIKIIHFVAHENHRFEVQVDSTNGDILAYSEHDDTIDRVPNGRWDKCPDGCPQRCDGNSGHLHVEVECENQDTWFEPRLKYTERGNWTVLPAEAS